MIDFGLVDAIDAEAIGEPGRRTFRVRARAGANLATLWIEKEQLTALGRGISQLLAERSLHRGIPAQRPDATAEFADRPTVEMEIVRLGVDFEPDPDRVILLADDQAGFDRGDTPTFRMEMTRGSAAGLVRAISEIVAAGRPRCPLCGRPMEGDNQHFCPGSDGYSAILEIPGPDEEDEE